MDFSVLPRYPSQPAPGFPLRHQKDLIYALIEEPCTEAFRRPTCKSTSFDERITADSMGSGSSQYTRPG
jgi:hypothetical protein